MVYNDGNRIVVYDLKFLIMSLNLLALNVLSAHGPCALFKFDNHEMNSGLLTAEEKTTINVTFRIINVTCPNASTIITEIDKLGTSKSYLPQCSIIDGNNPCRSFISSCVCLSTKLVYRFTKIATKLDNTQWRWKLTVGSETAIIKYISFNITYRATITKFTLDRGEGPLEGWGPFHVTKEQWVHIACFWTKDNPEAVKRLLHRNGTVLKTSRQSETSIEIKFSSVSCHDSGIIRCAVGDLVTEKSLLMLVQCPPQFGSSSGQRLIAVNGQNANLHFPFSSHTSTITVCEVIRIQYPEMLEIAVNHFERPSPNDFLESRRKDAEHLGCEITHSLDKCTNNQVEKCRCSVNGTPPYMMLHLHLCNYILNSKSWSLNVSNNFGSGQVEFLLQYQNDSTVTHIISGTQSTTTIDNTSVIFFSSGTALFVAFIASCITGLAIFKHKWKMGSIERDKQQPQISKKEIDSDEGDLPYHSNQQTGQSVPPPVGEVSVASPTRNAEAVISSSMDTVPSDITCASQVLNKESNGGDQCVKILCQPTDVTKVVLYLREQPSSTFTSQSGTTLPSVSADYLTPESEYSSLKPTIGHSPDKCQYSRMLEQKFSEFLSALTYGSLEHRNSILDKKNVAKGNECIRNFKDVSYDDSEDSDYSNASVPSSSRVSYDEPDYNISS